MSDNSKIEWTDATWNPVTGCTKVSPGCDHCYAERIVERFKGKGSFAVVQRSEEKLYAPMKWRTPRMVFVNSMSDLFHDDVPTSFIVRVFSVMARTPQHTYQLLTKRHGRMRSLLTDNSFHNAVFDLLDPHHQVTSGPAVGYPNLWLGVSVENQQWADIRIPALLDTAQHGRWKLWLSCEPLLGPVDLHLIETVDGCTCAGGIPESSYLHEPHCGTEPGPTWGRLHWVVCGGESGPGARPMHPDWARSLRDQCQAAGVPYFFKQWGEWYPVGPLYDLDDDPDESEDARMEAAAIEVEERKQVIELETSGYIPRGHQPGDPRTWLMARLGKKAAGRQLDGRTWDEYPVVEMVGGK